MDRDTTITIMELLAKEKRDNLKVVNETDKESVKQCFMNRVTGMNIALDIIFGYARRNGVDVSEVEW